MAKMKLEKISKEELRVVQNDVQLYTACSLMINYVDTVLRCGIVLLTLTLNERKNDTNTFYLGKTVNGFDTSRVKTVKNPTLK